MAKHIGLAGKNRAKSSAKSHASSYVICVVTPHPPEVQNQVGVTEQVGGVTAQVKFQWEKKNSGGGGD